MRLPEPTSARLKDLFKSSYYAQALVIKSDILISERRCKLKRGTRLNACDRSEEG